MRIHACVADCKHEEDHDMVMIADDQNYLTQGLKGLCRMQWDQQAYLLFVS